jgi:hypothetical protein
MKIILLTGVMGSGKDHYANEYIKNHPEERVIKARFAQPLRDIMQIVLRVNFDDEIFYENWKLIPDNRQIFLNLSSHLKSIYGQDVLIVATRHYLRMLFAANPKVTVIFTDCRFPFEYYMVKDFIYTELKNATSSTDYKKILKVIFCNYKSDRYAKKPEQVTERWALNLLENLPKTVHKTDITKDLLMNPVLTGGSYNQ